MEKQTAPEEEIKGKELFYRGKSIEYLKSLDVREAAKFLPSRSRRSVLRNFDKIELFIQRAEKRIAAKKKIRTQFRELVIVPKLVGMAIGVHNGKEYNEVHITHEMIGHRLGEFLLTRKNVKHGNAGIGATKGSRAAQK